MLCCTPLAWVGPTAGLARQGWGPFSGALMSLNNIIIAKRVITPENASGVYKFTHGGHFWDFPVHRKKSSSHRKIFNGCVEYIVFLQGWRVPVHRNIFMPKRCKNWKMFPECINSHTEGTLGFSGAPEKIQFAPENASSTLVFYRDVAFW